MSNKNVARINLQTKRLNLVPMTEKDLDVFHDTNTNPVVKKYLWDNEEIAKSVSADILKEVNVRFENEKWGLWKILNAENNEYMGYIGLWFFFDEKLPQLLYALLPEFTGNGYATEASTRIVNYAFEELNFQYLIATMDTLNKGSINVCERLNMSRVEEKEIDGKPTLFFKVVNESYSKEYS